MHPVPDYSVLTGEEESSKAAMRRTVRKILKWLVEEVADPVVGEGAARAIMAVTMTKTVVGEEMMGEKSTEQDRTDRIESTVSSRKEPRI